MELDQRHATIVDLHSHFDYDHLPSELQVISAPFHALACSLLAQLEDSPQVALGLQKLLEAKDCFVRAANKQFAVARHDNAVLTSEKLQELRKQAIVDFSAKLDRICAENPMGVELPGADDPFPDLG